jgi:ATP-dependent RNA helicase DeaD
MVSLRLNVGRRQSVLPPQIIAMINKATDSGNIRIGRISLEADSCEVQVDSAMAQRVEQALSGYSHQGTRIRVERIAHPRRSQGKQRGPWQPKKGRKKKANRTG